MEIGKIVEINKKQYYCTQVFVIKKEFVYLCYDKEKEEKTLIRELTDNQYQIIEDKFIINKIKKYMHNTRTDIIIK